MATPEVNSLRRRSISYAGPASRTEQDFGRMLPVAMSNLPSARPIPDGTFVISSLH